MKAILNGKAIGRMKQKTHMFSDNEVPYISTYHINAKIKSNETATIEFYVTDWEQTEYFDDKVLNFTLKYGVDGVEYEKEVTSGDNFITLPQLSIGEHEISMQIIDEYGRCSHVLWNEILVVDENYSPNYYVMTEQDLTTYKINNANSQDEADLENTHAGINQLWQDKAEDYDGIIMLPGTYRIKQVGWVDDGEGTGRHVNTYSLMVPSNFTIDLNGSTIKQHVYEGDASVLICFFDCFDSHLINGTLEGDYDEHYIQYGHGEHCYTIDFQGLCKYCSIENLLITNTVGYTTISQSKLVSFSTGNHDLEDGDIVNGVLVPHKERRSSKSYLDISSIASRSKWIRGSIYLGYSGVVSNSWVFDFHFYDSQKRYISSSRSFQFRKCKLPENATYCKLTFHDKNIEHYNGLTVYDYKNPRNCEIKNVVYKHTRTCGIATCQTDNLYIKDCEFTDCAVSITPLPIDLEDGWFGTLDTTFDNINVHDNLQNIALVCSGHNTIFQNCEGEQLQITLRGGWNASRSGVVRNCNIGVVNNSCDKHLVQAYSRIIDSTLKNGVAPQYAYAEVEDRRWLGIKNCNIENQSSSVADHLMFMSCTFDGAGKGSISCSDNIMLKRCTIKNYNNSTSCVFRQAYLYDCDISNVDGRLYNAIWINNCRLNGFKIFNFAYEGNTVIKNSDITNLNINCLYYQITNSTFTFSNNTITNTDLNIMDYSPLAWNGATFINNTITTNKNVIYITNLVYSTVVNYSLFEMKDNTFITDSNYIIDAKQNEIGQMKEGDNITIVATNNQYSNSSTLLINPLLQNSKYVTIDEK